MDATSRRPDIVVDESGGVPTITLLARNPLVAGVSTLAGGFIVLCLMAVAAYGLSAGNAVTVLVMTALAGGVVWQTWRIGWRRRRFVIAFAPDRLEVGDRRFAYADIRSHGMARQGGDAFDPASMPLPRNHTLGPHLYVETGGRQVPITVGLSEGQAREAARAFARLFDAHRGG